MLDQNAGHDHPDADEPLFEDAASSEGERDDADEEEGVVVDGRLSSVRVLIVDDDADIRDSFEAAFQSEGALTQVCSDGQDAVRICHEDPPDVVILDMMLPKRSGFLVLEKIKGREDSPIVIMVTANEGKRHQAYAESLGADRYLLKPVPLDRLLEVTLELLDEADAADDSEA